MIIFKSIKYKNFLSVGNNPIEIDLCSTPLQLLVGKNGSSKTTVAEGIFFSLFGKPYRKIKKSQLINSINQKHCYVELKFSIDDKDEYIVERGIKPDVFKITKNGNVIEKGLDYQKELDNITNLNPVSFKQIVSLSSSASFVPFMRLSVPERRKLIEDLLDIRIFSFMSIINKAKLGVYQKEIDVKKLLLSQNKILLSEQENFLKKLLEINEDTLLEKSNKIKELSSEIAILKKKIKEKYSEGSLDIEKEKIRTKEDKNSNKIKELETLKIKLNEQKRITGDTLGFFENHTTCPTCKTEISPEIRDSEISKNRYIQLEASNGISYLNELILKHNSIKSECKHKLSKIELMVGEFRQLNYELTYKEKELDKLEKEYQSLKISPKEEIVFAKNKIISIQSEIDTQQKSLDALLTRVKVHTIIQEFLKDDGIRGNIVSKFIPKINELVNKFLEIFGFYVSFELDEEFNETIRSRYRDNFSYESFSEGQKQRIDLALLFTWREIAKLRNSVDTNLLILDEVFDSSLDSEGHSALNEIFSSFEYTNTNVFVISHKLELIGTFPKTLEFYIDGNFSAVREI